MGNIFKAYADTTYGQIHARILEAVSEVHPPLICLHPAPSSGHYFSNVMPLLNAERSVIALNYPGYGGSDAGPDEVSIGDYADAMQQAAMALNIQTPVDLLGFHTGCLVANEWGLNAPDSIRQLVLCDVPYFTADVRPELKKNHAQPMAVTADLQSLEKIWTFNVASRVDHTSLPRALSLLAEHLRSAPNDHKAFQAAFSYDCEERFALQTAECCVLATESGLLDPSRAAATQIPNATLVEALEVKTAVFESGAKAIASRILATLTESK